MHRYYYAYVHQIDVMGANNFKSTDNKNNEKTETDHKRHVRQYKIVKNINSCNWSPRRTGERKMGRKNTLKDNKNFLEKESNT